MLRLLGKLEKVNSSWNTYDAFIMFLYDFLATIICIEGSDLLMNPRQPSQQLHKSVIGLSVREVFPEILAILHSFNIFTGRERPPA